MTTILFDLFVLAVLAIGLTSLRRAPAAVRVFCWVAAASVALYLGIR